jgi:hypothetical protein
LILGITSHLWVYGYNPTEMMLTWSLLWGQVLFPFRFYSHVFHFD